MPSTSQSAAAGRGCNATGGSGFSCDWAGGKAEGITMGSYWSKAVVYGMPAHMVIRSISNNKHPRQGQCRMGLSNWRAYTVDSKATLIVFQHLHQMPGWMAFYLFKYAAEGKSTSSWGSRFFSKWMKKDNKAGITKMVKMVEIANPPKITLPNPR